MKSQYILYVRIEPGNDLYGDLDEYIDDLYGYFLIGELLDENKTLFEDSCLCNPEIMEGLRDEIAICSHFYFLIQEFKLIRFNEAPSQIKYNLRSIKNQELKNSIEQLRLCYSESENKIITLEPVPVVSDPPAVVSSAPIVDSDDEQDKVQDYCLELELSDTGNSFDTHYVAILYIGKINNSQSEHFRKRCLIELKRELQSEMIRCYYNSAFLSAPISPILYLSMLLFKELTPEQEARLDCSFKDEVIDKLESIRKECCKSFPDSDVSDNSVLSFVSDSPMVSSSAPVDSDLTDNKSAKTKQRKVAKKGIQEEVITSDYSTKQAKGGRPSKKTIDSICFAIIKMFISYQSQKTIDDIKELDDAVKKINRRLQDFKCNTQINVRQLDGDKIPGRLFRYLWTIKMKTFVWGYNQEKFERDKEIADEYKKKYSAFEEWLNKNNE